MAVRSFNIMSICAGVGGLDLGLKIAIRRARTVCYVEREAFAAATLVSQMENGALAHAPIWSDLITFDGRQWRGVVHCITAGLPCQPYSLAGKQLGHADERALYPELVRVVDEVRPNYVFLENVPAFAKHFEPLGNELHRLGYAFEAGFFSAAEVGAPHKRERFFCLAYRVGVHSERWGIHRIVEGSQAEEYCETLQRQWDGNAVGNSGSDVEHPESDGRGQGWAEPGERRSERRRSEVGNPNEPGLEGRGLQGRECESELPAWPPMPGDRAGWDRVPATLKPAVCWSG